MAEPALDLEGNLRLATLACDGLPPDPRAVHARALALLEDQRGVEAYGAPSILVDFAPDDPAPATWRCQVGSPVIGLATPQAPLLVEDYRGLQALSLPHPGPRRELAATHRALADHARAMGWRLRPYWRIALPTRRSGDGHLVPDCVVSVFLDR